MSTTPAYIDHNRAPQTGRILVVDDDVDFAAAMDLLLTPEGYEVMLVHSAVEAMKRIAGFRADVALIDIRLSGSSGLHLITTLNQHYPNILCIMMTAFSSTDTAIKALQEGAYGYLVKPFGRDELLVTVEKCFERLGLEKEKAETDSALRTRNQELEQVLEQLAKSEQRYHSLVDTCPICIKEVDLSGKLISMNLSGLVMMGFDDASEAHGLDFFELLTPDDRSRVRDLFAEASGGRVCNFESTAVLGTGPRAVACSFAPLLSSDGAVHKIMAITQDITEQKAAEERLQDENIYLREEVRIAHGFDEVIGDNLQLKRSLEAVKKVAPTNLNVLILGETGTGKELFARAVHNLSTRRNKPMVSVSCPALPATLIESELFGHEKGAFTGAQSQRKGRFELANGSTIFLDELGDLPLELQSKLLRVLQTGQFERLGGTRTIHSDARLIAATNRNLMEAVDKGEFRADLFYRINTFPIYLPALRDRKDDILLLAEHFVRKHAKRLGKEVDAISSSMIKALMDYSWPGNVRELESVIERTLISLAGNSVLMLTDPLPSGFRTTEPVDAGDNSDSLSTVQRFHILNVLEEANWVITGSSGAADALGMPPSTLRSKMKRLGISRNTA